MQYKFYQYPRGMNSGGVLNTIGISPTVMENHGTVNAIVEPIIFDDYNQRIPKDQSVIGTITTNIGASAPRNGIKIIEPTIMAMRGRNPDNPSERGKSNGKYKQRLEMNNNGTSNTITGVQKDNLVVEPTKMQAMVNNALLTKDISYGDTYNPYNDTLDKTSISPTLTTRPEGNKTAVLPVVPNLYLETVVGDLEPKVINPLKGQTDNGWHYEQQIYADDGITRAMKACGGSGNIPKVISELTPKYRIRKLTPKECFRLMGVDDADIDTMQASGISNSSQYKLAGNSIVVDVLYHIFRKAFVEKENESQQLTFF